MMIRNRIGPGRWLCALLGALVALCRLTPPAHPAEPMPEIMQTLLRIFPEHDGWFIEEPLGLHPKTPQQAQQFFLCERIVVPDLSALDLAVGKLLQAAPLLPIKKVTRYDRDPDAPGLVGFRGVWCATEDKELLGVSVLTPQQNRFLIWARDRYFPAFDNDSIQPKVRDWYARSVGQYLASLDAGVPDTEPPVAASRTLPEWMDLLNASNTTDIRLLTNEAQRGDNTEIKAWGLHDLVSFTPTRTARARFAADAPDTLWESRYAHRLQRQLEAFASSGRHAKDIISFGADPVDSTRVRSLASGLYAFAVDRFGRVRLIEPAGFDATPIHLAAGVADWQGLLFPAAPVLTAGYLQIEGSEHGARLLRIISESPFNCYAPDHWSGLSDLYLESIGHLLGALTAHEQNGLISLDELTISK